MNLRIAYLYAHFLNIYGDRGNIVTLAQRARWREIEVIVDQLGLNERFDPEWYDLYFIGGGQDKQQQVIAQDLLKHADRLHQATQCGAVVLSVCGGYQLLGHYYRPHNGSELKGISLLDAYTVAGSKRMIGNVVIKRKDGTTLVGFENHSGKTYLGPHLEPLGKVFSGHGNNDEDGLEGAVSGTIYGTYLHGSLLPKNPCLADELLTQALIRRHGSISLATLDDTLETSAHKFALGLPA
ncbi:MAG: glutamine amidotransferase [Candidatus Melainabacteria bacterium]|nr:glutamine amidotransferase [Candidatus Melainabacteria bacterium]